MVEENKSDAKFFNEKLSQRYLINYSLKDKNRANGICPHCNARIGKCTKQPLVRCSKCNKLVTSLSFCKDEPTMVELYSHIFKTVLTKQEIEKLMKWIIKTYGEYNKNKKERKALILLACNYDHIVNASSIFTTRKQLLKSFEDADKQSDLQRINVCIIYHLFFFNVHPCKQLFNFYI